MLKCYQAHGIYIKIEKFSLGTFSSGGVYIPYHTILFAIDYKEKFTFTSFWNMNSMYLIALQCQYDPNCAIMTS